MTINGTVREESSEVLKQHSRGLLNPRDKTDFSESEKDSLEGLEVHNFGHRSWISKQEHDAYTLPPGRDRIESCTVPELKAMVGARGGNTVSNLGEPLLKKDLVKIMKGYFSIEEKSPTLIRLYGRNKVSSGSFIGDLNVKNDDPADKTLKVVLESNFIRRPGNRLLQKEMYAALNLALQKKLISGIDDIAEIIPEIIPGFIYKSYGYIGESEAQKNIGSALQRLLEQTELSYHGIAFSEDRTKLYVLSKQKASMTKDESTRKKVAAGERPDFKLYLVLMVLGIEKTTHVEDGHVFGRITHIIVSYCGACVCWNGWGLYTLSNVPLDFVSLLGRRPRNAETCHDGTLFGGFPRPKNARCR